MNTAIDGLRHATHDLHLALEQTALAKDLLSPTLARGRYVEILRRWADSWGVLEASVQQSPCLDAVRPLLAAARAAHALQDLDFLGEPREGVHSGTAALRSAQCSLQVPATAAALLGRCYVMRGSSLGGQVIARHLASCLGLVAHQGASFFASGEAELLTWPQWCKQLEQRLVEPQARQEACEEARHTFNFLLEAFA